MWPSDVPLTRRGQIGDAAGTNGATHPTTEIAVVGRAHETAEDEFEVRRGPWREVRESPNLTKSLTSNAVTHRRTACSNRTRVTDAARSDDSSHRIALASEIPDRRERTASHGVSQPLRRALQHAHAQTGES